MLYPPSLSRLIEALRCLPGVGPKSAQRMAFHLLERDPDGAREIAAAVGGAIDGIARFAQRRRQLPRESRLVLDHQHAHGDVIPQGHLNRR